MAKENIIDFVLGLPPNDIDSRTNTVIKNSMPLVKIYPGIPSFTEGLSLFTRTPAFQSQNAKSINGYHNLLQAHGFTLNQPEGKDCLVAAYQADSFPTDSFTNEYGENFLQKLTDVASEGAATLSQIAGVRNVGEAVSKIQRGLKSGGTASQFIGDMVGKGQEMTGDLIKSLSSIPGGKSAQSGLKLASALAAGGRIDFPMVWKGSGFQPSYTMTIRLYNPNPGNDETTKKYIVGPIAALLLLGIPVSADGSTYSWPFIHRIWSPGIYDLDPAFISNITVIKGGDQQQISYKQKLAIVDVRIDFGSLFNSILAAPNLNKSRPTLQRYLDAMQGNNSEKSGVYKFSSTGITDSDVNQEGTRVSGGIAVSTKNQAPTETQPTTEEKQNPPQRIASAIKSAADSLISRIPSGFKIG